MSYDVELEKDVLAASLQGKRFLSLASTFLEPEHFSTRTFAWIWEQTHDVFRKHRELIDPTVLLAKIEDDFDEGDHEFVEDVLEALYDRESSSPKAALDQIRAFVKMTEARRAADGVLDGIDAGDLDAAEGALDAGAAAIRRASAVTMPRSWTGGAKERLATYEARGKPGGRLVFRTMLETINFRAIPAGGLPVGKIAEVLATTNIGKTTFLVDLGYAAMMKSGAAVLHITTEDPAEEVELRYDARFTGISRDKLDAGRLSSKDKKQFKEAFEKAGHIADNLAIHYLPKGHRVNSLGALIEAVREDHPDRPILLNYDSPYHAKGPTNRRERRHELKDIMEYVDNLTKDESLGLGDVACWFTHHARRQDAGKVPTAESGAESYDIERIVDFAIGLREGDELIGSTEKSMEAWITKNRLGPLRRAVIYMKADLSICKFREVAFIEAEEEDG
jgi:hypothetical protein